ncbi:uncharacterized protein LOC112565963 [Pomacea canaliculata]|uniref:uncharacterized protein LOC112565963 n=1 Tax=Pomacea canaliculata TaxID=400727 RepID=UPI000D731A21|nr:uncharacterized protein LOC112565963 [Pomacea canaliculata]
MNLSLTISGSDPKTKISYLPWNNPDNILSYQAYTDTVFHYNNILKPLVISVGVSTNIINCVVFTRQGLRDRMNLCLFVLALVDMTYLAYSLIFTLAFWIRLLEPILGEEVYQKTYYYATGANFGFRETSACISVLIAVERCVCVVFPLRANNLMSTRTMGILLVAIVIGMQLAFVTTPIKRYVLPTYDNITGETRWRMVPSAAWQNSEGLLRYDVIEDTIMMVIFPLATFILVSGATAITVVKLRAAMSWREKTSSTSSDAQVQQVALTKMLVLVSCIFIASKVPWIALTVARIFYPDFSPSGRQSNVFRVAELIAFYFPYVHSAVNFFIYISRSSRYKSELRAICNCPYNGYFHKGSV